MKDTVGSLRVYFIVVAAFTLIINTAALVNPNVNILTLILVLIKIILATFYLYIGIKLRKVLVESPQLIINVIIANLTHQVISFLYFALILIYLEGDLVPKVGFITGVIIEFAIGLWISWYLLNTTKRLSEEEKYKTEARSINSSKESEDN